MGEPQPDTPPPPSASSPASSCEDNRLQRSEGVSGQRRRIELGELRTISRHESCCSSPFETVSIEKIDEHVGRGLVARLSFSKGEVVYVDTQPLISAQQSYSQRVGLACAECFKFTGSLYNHAKIVLENEKKEDLEKRSPHIFSSLEALLHGSNLEKRDLILGPVLPCTRGCGAVYCSSTCRSIAETLRHHRLVCTDADPTRVRAWKAFTRHAMKYHENFILGGLTFAQIICDVRYGGKTVEEAMRPFLGFHAKRWETLGERRRERGTRRKQEGENLRPDDAARLSNSGNTAYSNKKARTREDVLSSFKGRLEIMSESFRLLSSCLITALGETETVSPERNASWAQLFSLSFYSHLLGTFDLVNVNIEFDNPLNERLARARSRLSEEAPGRDVFGPQCQKLLREVKRIIACDDNDTQQEEDETTSRGHDIHRIAATASGDAGKSFSSGGGVAEEEEIFPPFIGIGLFSAVSMTNHSCWPNVEVDYPYGDKRAVVRALRDIKAGEELRQSYIDETLRLRKRRRQLKQHYKFTCNCPRCRVEAAEISLLRRGALPPDEPYRGDALAEATGIARDDIEKILQYDAENVQSDSSDSYDDHHDDSDYSEERE
ncbi:histone lysine set [Cystoisospora suis]|uniref:Histone lysine set n=1 Tax=Cystoisospora suis TaxID=483139 RepID=A0A2C6KNI4_9APIC|nr:histone lysine set [Cystoisospora suis]